LKRASEVWTKHYLSVLIPSLVTNIGMFSPKM